MRLNSAVFFAFLVPAVAAAGVVRPLTDVVRPSVTLGALDDASTGVWAVTAADPLGTNPGNVPQVFRWDPVTGAVGQVTFFADGLVVPSSPDVLSPVPGMTGVSVSDDGLWIAFLSRGDLTGQNPDRNVELFLMKSDGSMIRQLTVTSDATAKISRFALSGNGSSVVFLYDGTLTVPNPDRMTLAYVVAADGTGLRRLTSAPPVYGTEWVSVSDDGSRAVVCEGISNGTFQVLAVEVATGTTRALTNLFGFCRIAEISGDGGMVAFETSAKGIPAPGTGQPECQGYSQIATVRWDGTQLREVSGACACQGSYAPSIAYGPTLLDDGSWVIHSMDDCGWEIYKTRTDGTSQVRLTVNWFEGECAWAAAPGGTGRIAFLCDKEATWAPGANPDGGIELHSTTQTGADPLVDPRQLSAVRSGDNGEPDLTPDGATVVFSSNAQPDGASPSLRLQIYRVGTAAGTPVAVTNFAQGWAVQPSVTDDGETLTFVSNADPFGLDLGDPPALYAIASNGTGLRRLTPADKNIQAAEVAGNGSVAAFASGDILTGGTYGVYRVDLDGTGLRLIGPHGELPSVDATGRWVAYVDDFEGQGRICRARADVTAPVEVLYSEPGQRVSDVRISGSGGVVAFLGDANPGGVNADRNEEVFVWEATTGTVRALTSTTAGGHIALALSRDGAKVAAVSTVPRFSPAGDPEVVRIDVATGAVERIDGLRPSGPGRLAIDEHGDRVAFDGAGRSFGGNADGNREIVFIDRTASASIRVSPGAAPTIVSWDVESGPSSYDVIRGDVASLAVAGSTVDLGAVTCVENDSGDAVAEDASAPAPGHAWFYVYRGSAGPFASPGTYGAGTGNRERVPAGGGCD
jgi:Tol biopolymer transport system component